MSERNLGQELAAALRERLDIIADVESRKNENAHMERLRAVSERVDALEQALPRPLDSELAHFLKRKSYDKALAYLEGERK